MPVVVALPVITLVHRVAVVVYFLLIRLSRRAHVLLVLMSGMGILLQPQSHHRFPTTCGLADMT